MTLTAINQANLIIDSYKHWLGVDLIDPTLSANEKAKALYEAPFVVVSHDTQDDPIFNYANLKAQQLWELSWEAFTSLPSKQSAEPNAREERALLLSNLKSTGYSDNYRGTRISSSGKRFEIINTFVWNLKDIHGNYCGQAASFAEWKFL